MMSRKPAESRHCLLPPGFPACRRTGPRNLHNHHNGLWFMAEHNASRCRSYGCGRSSEFPQPPTRAAESHKNTG